jgi:hypothetical protein
VDSENFTLLVVSNNYTLNDCLSQYETWKKNSTNLEQLDYLQDLNRLLFCNVVDQVAEKTESYILYINSLHLFVRPSDVIVPRFNSLAELARAVRQFRVLIRRQNRPGQSDERTEGQSVGRTDFRGGARV